MRINIYKSSGTLVPRFRDLAFMSHTFTKFRNCYLREPFPVYSCHSSCHHVVTGEAQSMPEVGGYPWVAAKLRQAIAAGDIRVGDSIPSVKALGANYNVSSETARRAAKQLE